jgi:hypothetical protein
VPIHKCPVCPISALRGKYHPRNINLCGERGSTLVAVLLIMAAISIIGMVGLNISTVELKISSNERVMRETFYLTEGAAFEGVQRLANAPRIDLEDRIYFWHHRGDAAEGDGINFRDPQQWNTSGLKEDNAQKSALDAESFFSAVEHRLAAGSSAVVTESRLYLNQVYGLSRKYDASDLVEIGYQLRY